MEAVAVLQGVLGAVVGSFLNVVIHRLPKGESLVKPRSRCPACGAQLAARDNVPLLSWVILRGHCRHCGERVSPRYPLVEALTALAFVAVVLARGVHDELVAFLPFTAVLVSVAFIDLEHRIVPNRILAPAAVWALVVSALTRPGELPELLVAGAAAFAFLLVAALVHPAGMGMGDVKLAGVMGLYLGASVIPALLLAFVAGSLVGVFVMLREGTEARKRAVAFAPFLALGGLVGLLVGPQLIDLYVDSFL